MCCLNCKTCAKNPTTTKEQINTSPGPAAAVLSVGMRDDAPG